MSQPIVKNATNDLYRTFFIKTYDTTGAAKDASAVTLTLLGGSVAATAFTGTITRHGTTALHKCVMTQPQSNNYALSEPVAVHLPVAGGFQEDVFSLLFIASPAGSAALDGAGLRTEMGLTTANLTQIVTDATTAANSAQSAAATASSYAAGAAGNTTQLLTDVGNVPTNAELTAALASTTLLQLAAQEFLKTLGMGRGNRVVLDEDTLEMITYGTDGTTEIARQPYTLRAPGARALKTAG